MDFIYISSAVKMIFQLLCEKYCMSLERTPK